MDSLHFYLERTCTHSSNIYGRETKKTRPKGEGKKSVLSIQNLHIKNVALISLWRWAMMDDCLEMRIHMMLGQPVYAEFCVIDDRM